MCNAGKVLRDAGFFRLDTGFFRYSSFFNPHEGTGLTDCIFTEAGTFTKDGIAKVLKDGKYYFINKEGKELTAERFDDASDFCGNTAFVVKEGTETWYKVTVNQ